jgi:guanine deaminase
VLDPTLNSVLEYRIAESDSLEDLLFALMILGDERLVRATYLMGKPC